MWSSTQKEFVCVCARVSGEFEPARRKRKQAKSKAAVARRGKSILMRYAGQEALLRSSQHMQVKDGEIRHSSFSFQLTTFSRYYYLRSKFKRNIMDDAL